MNPEPMSRSTEVRNRTTVHDREKGVKQREGTARPRIFTGAETGGGSHRTRPTGSDLWPLARLEPCEEGHDQAGANPRPAG